MVTDGVHGGTLVLDAMGNSGVAIVVIPSGKPRPQSDVSDVAAPGVDETKPNVSQTGAPQGMYE